ncbi:MAG TPA: hypothetical protein VGN88_00345 [Phycisphaerae bacterium]|jgi:hypothetical protein
MMTDIKIHRSVRRPRGVILITAMWICIALAAVVLVLCRQMMIESMTSTQHVAQAKASAAEIGAEQFVMSVLEQELGTPNTAGSPGYKDQVQWERREVGDCYVYWIRNNPDEEDAQQYGIVDEGSKVDLNTSTTDMLNLLPEMDQYTSVAAAIKDWVDPDEDVTTDAYTGEEGAESTYYEGLDTPYHAKNLPLESVEELRLVAGVDEELLYGADTNHNGVVDINESANADASLNFETSSLGIVPFVTVYGLKATNPILTPSDTGPTGVAPTTTTNTNTATATTNPNSSPAGIYSDPFGNIVVDVNSTTTQQLQLVLQQYIGGTRANTILTATTARTSPTTAGRGTTGRGATGRGATGATGTTATGPFTSIWDWAVTTQLTVDEFTEVYPYVVAILPTPTATTTTTTTTTPPANTTGTTTAASAPTTPVGRININTAAKPAMMCIPGLEEADVDAIIAYREGLVGQDPTQVPIVAWLLDNVIQPGTDGTSVASKLTQAGPYITGQSTVFSADIVTVTKDGRAFKRVKIVVDDSTGTPQIIYRRDLSDGGWPLSADIRDLLRKGEEPPITGNNGVTSSSSPVGLN